MNISTNQLLLAFKQDENGKIQLSQQEFYKAVDPYLDDTLPYLANVPEDIFLHFLEAEIGKSSLYFKPNGWTVKLTAGLFKTAAVSAILGGILTNLQYSQIPSIVLPTIIPFLFEIEKCTLSKKDEVILGELYLNQKIKNKLLSGKEIYEMLPKATKKEVSYLDFQEFLDKLNITGFLDKNQEKYTFNPKDNPKFKLTFI